MARLSPSMMGKRHFRDYDEPGAPEHFEASHFGSPVGRFFLESQQELVQDLLEPDDRAILDLGTGTGRIAIPLARAGARVFALDASRQMLERAREKSAGSPSLHFQQGDAHRLPFAPGSFDCVISFRTLMHFDAWRDVVGEMCNVSRRTVIFDAPPRFGVAFLESLGHRIQRALGRPVAPYRTFQVGQLREELERRGFRVTSIERQFVLPFKLHRRIGRLGFTRTSETLLDRLGLRRLFGAPIIVKAVRAEA